MKTNNLFYDHSINIPYYQTTREDLELAETTYNNLYKNGNNTLNERTVYDRKESRIAGILGEIVFQKLYPESISVFSRTYDFKYKDYKVDVKCKLRKVPPKLHFEASFFAYYLDTYFEADMFYFMSTVMPMEKVWLCGYDTKENISKNLKTVLWKTGQTDHRNGMHFEKDTICIPYQNLKQINKEILEGRSNL